MIAQQNDVLTSSIGQTWDVWLKSTSTSTSNDHRSRFCNVAASTSTVATMPHKKALCYGSCPSQDEFLLLQCKQCALLMKPIAYRHHMNTQHGYRLPTTRSGVDEENEPISSVFSSPELNTIDDFDAILLSPLSISHRHSPSTSAPISQSKQHKNNIVYNRTGDSAAYYVKQRADLVIKFSKKNVDTNRQIETTVSSSTPRTRNRRKQILKSSPSSNGASPVIKFEHVDSPTTSVRLQQQQHLTIKNCNSPPLSTNELVSVIDHQSSTTHDDGRIGDLSSSIRLKTTLDGSSSHSTLAALLSSSDDDDDHHPRPQSSSSYLTRFIPRASSSIRCRSIASLATFDRRYDSIRTIVQRIVSAPLSIVALPNGTSFEAFDARTTSIIVDKVIDVAPNLRRLLTSSSMHQRNPQLVTVRKISPDQQTHPMAHNYAKGGGQTTATITSGRSSAILRPTSATSHQWRGTVPSTNIAIRPQMNQHQFHATTTSSSILPKKRPAVDNLMPPPQQQQRKRIRPNVSSQHQRPVVIQPSPMPNSTQSSIAFSAQNNSGQWRKIDAKKPSSTIFTSNVPSKTTWSGSSNNYRSSATVVTLPTHGHQIAGLVESGHLKLLPYGSGTNSQISSSSNGHTAYILPNKNGVVTLTRATSGGAALAKLPQSTVTVPTSQSTMYVSADDLSSPYRTTPIWSSSEQQTSMQQPYYQHHLINGGQPASTIYRLPIAQQQQQQSTVCIELDSIHSA